MKKNYQSQDLLYKYKTGTCTDEEKAIVESWHVNELSNSNFIPEEEELNRAGKAIWAALPIHNDVPVHKTISLWRKYAVAASVVWILSIGGIYLLNQKQQDKIAEPEAKRFKNDVNPGGNKAILTLADGSKISLDDVADGKVAQQSGIAIRKTADGQLVYDVVKAAASDKSPQFNTISTPHGGQYQVNLPDGTKVWLNAVSSLKYPTVFAGDFRNVELSGEAYFEVAKNKKLPFVVHSDKQVVEVLGTHFNINSYPSDSQVKTTLLEGSVKVVKDSKSYMLKPGEQAVIGSSVQVNDVDVEQVVAWVNGDFNFKDESVKSIMQKLQRWYDIEVVYEGRIPEINFGAEISRKRSLNQVLKVLEQTGAVRFKVEGRRVTVMQ